MGKDILVFNNNIIESRASDNFINATQMCKAGGKKFAQWFMLESTKELIRTLEEDLKLNTNIVDVQKGRYGGSWVHPDLAVQLAQWISPKFAIQVSRWTRELLITGSVSIDSKKTNEELNRLQSLLTEKTLLIENKEKQIVKLERKQLALSSYVNNLKELKKDQVIYLATTKVYASNNRFEFGGVKSAFDLSKRINNYNTGRAEGNLMYVSKVFKCNNYKIIEDQIHSVLSQFKDKLNSCKEMIHLRYNLLLEVVGYICDNCDKEVDYINSKYKEFLNSTIEEDPIVPEPVNLSDCLEKQV
jgi:hypothetical protein